MGRANTIYYFKRLKIHIILFPKNMFPSMFDEDPFFGNGRQRNSNGKDQLANRNRRDPFDMVDAMMGGFGGMMPFAGGRGDPFDGFDLMDMNSGKRGGGGGGAFSCQTMVMSSRMGPDGKMHTEKFASSSAGDATRGFHERQQAYSNSSTGMDKMSMERQMGSQGRKMIKERTRGSQDERQTDLYRGIEEHQGGEFDERWNREAAPYMPRHGGHNMQRIDGREQPSQRALVDRDRRRRNH